MELSNLTVPLWIWGILSLLIGLFFVYVWPEKRAERTSGLTRIVLRWAHPLVWTLVGLSLFVRRHPTGTIAANLTIAVAGLFYLMFILTLFSSREG